MRPIIVLGLLLCVGCGPRSLPPLAPVAACGATLHAPSTWQRVALGADSLMVAMPPGYVFRDTVWAGRAGVLAVRRVPGTLAPPPDAREIGCDTMLAARRVRLGTSAFRDDFGPLYTVRAAWASPNGGQLLFLGYARDSTGQRELLTVLYSMEHQ